MRKRILLVDDDPHVLRLLTQWLTAEGCAVIACDGFDDAKHQLAIWTPDVLLTDLRLGAFNGLQLVILARERHPRMQMTVMSAFDDPTLREEATRCGARYLAKPLTKQMVLSQLDDPAIQCPRS